MAPDLSTGSPSKENLNRIQTVSSRLRSILFRFAVQQVNDREKKEAPYVSFGFRYNHTFTNIELCRSIGFATQLAVQCPRALAGMLVVAPTTRAILPPPIPDRGYRNGNTAEGDRALQSLTNGSFNTANGNSVLLNNTSGTGGTAVGFQALLNNTGRLANTAIGYVALSSNTNGSSNTAIGVVALAYNTTGDYDTAIGLDALEFNAIDSFNTASGF